MLISNTKISDKQNKFGGYYMNYSPDEKFKFFLDSCQIIKNENEYLYIRGIITNRKDVIGDLSCEKHFSNNDIDLKILQSFMGTFQIIYVNKNIMHLISDHFGSKPIFYYFTDKKYAISNDLYELNKGLKNIRTPKLDENSIYEMLTYGFMLEENTILKDIKAVPPATVIRFDIFSGNMVSDVYHEFDFSKMYNFDLNTHLKNVKEKFEEATQKIFLKDIEHGYKHLVTISGGLDSRLVNATARQLGFKNMVNLSIGQSTSLDLDFASQVSNKLNIPLIMEHLDSGMSLLKYNQVIKRNYGLVLYSGMSHMYNVLCNMDLSKFGVIHSGQLGDVIFGNFTNEPIKNIRHEGFHSSRFINKIKLKGYENQRDFLFKTRGFNGVIRSHLALNEFSEYWSPFLDISLLEYCLHIPSEIKRNHKFYKEYFKKYHYDLAKIGSDRYFGANLLSKKFIVFLYKLKYFGIKFLSKYLAYKLGLVRELNEHISRKTMNPFSMWGKNRYLSNEIKLVINETLINFENHISENLMKDINVIINEGNITEKTQLITVLITLKTLNLPLLT